MELITRKDINNENKTLNNQSIDCNYQPIRL